ncbi:nickel and cobalt resistance protein cnrC [Novosphingobium sp. Rr 2-17]|uniref:TolC family protein n=1 Tax=Novosphingobium sp. Rr 2-17 TaxID=555793 RepID=UPI000269817C|nr:TolC family protein [Novosphingobium sp. Rr 2-17]EIZ81252.1 nickel and cobalt resistance protein cnrC [Novosphingobium sp. Rr 2-17]
MLVSAPVAWADTAPSYAELLSRSIENAPALLEQVANVRAAQGDARQARAWPNPSIGADFENIGGSSVSNSPSTPQTTFTVTQPLDVFKRGPRIAAGNAGIVAAQARGAQAKVEYAAQLALAYATSEAMQQRLQLADEDVGRAREDLRAANALVDAGKEAKLRSVQAQASVSSAVASREAALSNLAEALANLSALAGVPSPYTGVTPSLLTPDVQAARVMGPSDGTPPAVAAAQAERDAVDAQVRVERSKAIPDIGLSGGVRRFGGSDETGFVVGVTSRIPLFDRNGGAIAATEARRDAADQRLAAARLSSQAARNIALTQITSSQARLKATTEGEAAAQEAYRLSRIGYDSGKTPLIEVLTIRRALLDARALTIDARLARVSALVALARVDGRLAFGDN